MFLTMIRYYYFQMHHSKKSYALWHAARRDDKGWFIALLIVNTLGILELIYLYYVAGVWKKAPPKATPLAPTPTAPNVPPSAQ